MVYKHSYKYSDQHLNLNGQLDTVKRKKKVIDIKMTS